jgi:hypothetical protein
MKETKIDKSLLENRNIANAADPRGLLALEKYVDTASKEQIAELKQLLDKNSEAFKTLKQAFSDYENAQRILDKLTASLDQVLKNALK